MRAEISKLQKRLQTSTIYVTHDQVEAMTMGDRIAILKGGDLQQVGTPLDIYRRPANTFVATFIGTPPMNLLDVAVDGGRLVDPDFELDVPSAWQGKVTTGRQVVLGIRPEHLRVLPGGHPGEDGGAATLKVTADVVECLGHETVIHARLADGAPVTTTAPPDLAVRPGDRLSSVVPVDEILLFDADSTRRL